ncbi:MAG: hypothetical protein L0228_10765 [Planctomycetes bacterium]|nr:hypothetical protein [Planctomycetota bacterium]
MAEQSTGDANTPSRFDPYGPNAHADETRQAQHMAANDTPLDVNLNAVVARSQALTFDIAGKNFEANGDLRQKYADAKFGKQT